MLFFSCHEDDIKVFDGKNELYFEKFYMDALTPGTEKADSTVESFFFYAENTHEIKADLVIVLSGRLLESDLKFQLKVVPEETTASPEEYILENSYTFRMKSLEPDAEGNYPKEIKDTISVRLRYSDRLVFMPQGVVLTVEIVPNDRMDSGQYERRRARIISTNLAEKPKWWDDEVTYTLLGKYSQAKYKLYLMHIDPNGELNGELLANDPARAIELVQEFKEWLLKNPGQTDENGEITVVI